MQVNLAFCQTSDRRLLITSERVGVSPMRDGFSTEAYLDENTFLACVVAAELEQMDTLAMIVAVLRVMQHAGTSGYVQADLSAKQMGILGLGGRGGEFTGGAPALSDQVLRTVGQRGLEEVLLGSPTPLAVVAGRELRIAFVNDAYAQILGQDRAAPLLGRLVLEALPELRGHTCVQSLERVYRSGEPMTGIEVKKKIRPLGEPGPVMEAHYELSYNPMKSRSGAVVGVLVFATDITEKVLDREVSTSREAQMYRQWAELDTIYRTAPLAMCYFDAKEFRIIRANSLQAETMGLSEQELIGRSVLEIFPEMKGLREMFERVARGESISNLEYTTDFPSAPGKLRDWVLNYAPVFDAFGKVEMITSIAMEVKGYERVIRGGGGLGMLADAMLGWVGG